MSSRVSLSRRDAEILDLALGDPDVHPQLGRLALRALDRLRLALAPKPKKVAATKARKAKVATKRATKREETSEIREAAVARSGGHCECGAGGHVDGSCAWDNGAAPLEMDHFFGRRHGQSVETVWMLSAGCHVLKTRNQPDAIYWLDLFIRHCERHGYTAEASRARARLQSLADVQAAAAVTKGEG